MIRIQIVGLSVAITAMNSMIKRADSGALFVGSNQPYAARIELGFHGYDSMGRFYNQGPQPWLLPAFLGVTPIAPAAIWASLQVGGTAMDGLHQVADEVADLSRMLVPKETLQLHDSIQVGDA